MKKQSNTFPHSIYTCFLFLMLIIFPSQNYDPLMTFELTNGTKGSNLIQGQIIIDSKIYNDLIAFLSMINTANPAFLLCSSDFFDKQIHITLINTTSKSIVNSFHVILSNVIMQSTIYFHIAKIISVFQLQLFISYSTINR